MSNPLLEFTDLIDFASFKAEDVVPAVKARIEAARKVLAAVTAPETPASFEDVI